METKCLAEIEVRIENCKPEYCGQVLCLTQHINGYFGYCGFDEVALCIDLTVMNFEYNWEWNMFTVIAFLSETEACF